MIWDLSLGLPMDDTVPMLVLKGHTDPVCDLGFSPEGKTLAIGSSDCEIKLWDLVALEQWNGAGAVAKTE
jgi:WD40 repeat protein